MRVITALTAALVLFVAAPHSTEADFIPGHVYISDPHLEGCQGPGQYPNDRIWDVDPATGQATVLITTPSSLCGGMDGLAFTPDGSRLRVSMTESSAVLEVDGQGGYTVALDSSNGLVYPNGSNNIDYDTGGSFYVVNQGGTILRFAPGSTTPSVFAAPSPLNNTSGPISIAPNGDVYYASIHDQVLRFSPEGELSVFATFPPLGSTPSLTVSSTGDLYVLRAVAGGILYRFAGGNPNAIEQVASGCLEFGNSSIAMSADATSIYLANQIFLNSIDIDTGIVSSIATLPTVWASPGAGIAVYIPEPGTLIMLACSFVLCRRRRSPGRPR